MLVAKFEEKCSEKCQPPFPQKLFTFVKQFIMKFEEFPRILGKLETLYSIAHRELKVFFFQYLTLG